MPTDDRSEPLCGEPHPSLLTADDGPARCARSRGHSGDHGTVEGTRWPSPDPVSEVREGLTAAQLAKAERDALDAGTHVPAVDDFGNLYFTLAGPEERGPEYDPTPYDKPVVALQDAIDAVTAYGAEPPEYPGLVLVPKADIEALREAKHRLDALG